MGKKRLKCANITPSSEAGELALLLSIDEYGDDGDKKRKTKRVQVPYLTPASDIEEMAQRIVDECKYIPSSKLEIVEHALMELQTRMLREAQMDAMDGPGENEASIHRIDEYIEMMYESDDRYKSKNRGTLMVVNLCKTVAHLELLIQNESLMQLLSRLLDTEHKKSLEMTFNILRIFLAFSSFMEMHSLLAQYKVGSLTLKVLHYETNRVNQRVKDFKSMDEEFRQLTVQTHSQALGADGDAMEALQAFKRKRDEQTRRMKKLKKWSEKTMHAAYYLLLNLAEDEHTERKMLKKGLLEGLVTHLEHSSSIPLLTMIVAFLKKLSGFAESKDRMMEAGVVRLLVRLLPCKRVTDERTDDALLHMVLPTLFNLSFDVELRAQMVKESLIPKLIDMFKASSPQHRPLILRLLYHLSTEDQVKAMFAYTDTVPIVMGMILNFPGEQLPRELAALAVNISWHRRIAESMCHFPERNMGLYELVARVERTKDPLLMKVIRNLSEWTFSLQCECEDLAKEYTMRGTWGRFIDRLIGLIDDPSVTQDLLVEVLGTLANLTMYDLSRGHGWAKTVERHDLLSLISRLLVPGMSAHDVVLEVTKLVGNIVTDERAVPLLASSTVIKSLYGAWQDKNEDSEIVLQLLVTFHRLLLFEASREETLYSTRAVSDMLECLDHPHPMVRTEAYQCLDIVLEFDRKSSGAPSDLGQQIIKRRFEAHNQEWLDAMDRERSGLYSTGMEQGSPLYSAHYGDMPGGKFDFEEEDEEYNRYFMEHGTERLAMDMNYLGGGDYKDPMEGSAVGGLHDDGYGQWQQQQDFAYMHK